MFYVIFVTKVAKLIIAVLPVLPAKHFWNTFLTFVYLKFKDTYYEHLVVW